MPSGDLSSICDRRPTLSAKVLLRQSFSFQQGDSKMSRVIQVRGTSAADVDALLTMIRKLAINNAAKATIRAPQLREDCFGERPWVRSIIAERAGKRLCFLVYGL